MLDKTRPDPKTLSTCEILSTSEAGDRLATRQNQNFIQGHATRNVIRVFPEQTRQTMHGIGTSFTESSAFVLAHLDEAERTEVMERLFSDSGANFSMARTVIGACDFSVEGRYSYADFSDDMELNHFSIRPDFDGFSKQRYPSVRNEEFDLLPMIRQALSIKSRQPDSCLRIIASAWTAPSWMKDIEDWYVPGSEDNQYQGTGGSLKPGYESCYASYLVKYLEAYRQHGIHIWGLTPVNEPHGNNGQWESMHFTAHTQNAFIKAYLGPALHSNGFSDIKLLMFDHNRDGLDDWADVMYKDPATSKYLYGAAVHWYESTVRDNEDVLARVHEAYPDFEIIHTEGCIDDLGNDAPEGVTDPDGYKESGWFANDEFWWNANATDWAYTATWPGVNVADHPAYTPVHRYARNIIESINNWLSGWIDWNCVLDQRGGPNHVGNYCGAPVMVDTASGEVYYTPVYYILSQLSRTIRPGDRAVQVTKTMDIYQDSIHCCATLNDNGLLTVQLLNTAKTDLDVYLQIGGQCVDLSIDANSLQSVRIRI